LNTLISENSGQMYPSEWEAKEGEGSGGCAAYTPRYKFETFSTIDRKTRSHQIDILSPTA